MNQVGGNDELVFDGHSLGIDPAGEVVLRAHDFAEDFLVYDVRMRRSRLRQRRRSASRLRDVGQSTTEDVWKALVLGLRDYVQKCGFSKAVLASPEGSILPSRRVSRPRRSGRATARRLDADALLVGSQPE